MNRGTVLEPRMRTVLEPRTRMVPEPKTKERYQNQGTVLEPRTVPEPTAVLSTPGCIYIYIYRESALILV